MNGQCRMARTGLERPVRRYQRNRNETENWPDFDGHIRPAMIEALSDGGQDRRLARSVNADGRLQ